MFDLEKYMIPAIEATSIVKKDEKLNFFGKEWTVKIVTHGYNSSTIVDPNTAISIFKKFAASSTVISKRIESEFCKLCNKFNDDPSYTGIPAGSIKSYTDIPILTITNVSIEKIYDTDKIAILLHGEYSIDDEHGWAIAFLNNKWNGMLYQYSADVYAKDFK